LIVDESGTVVWEAERTVYGVVHVLRATGMHCDVRFAGQLYDEHVGLVYNRMRWYEPAVAQYVLADRIGLDGGLNFRDYVSNPTAYIDPMGYAARPSSVAGDPVGNYPTGWGDRPDRPASSDDMTPGYMTTPGHFATEGVNGVPGSIVCSDRELKAAGHGGGENNFSKSTTEAIDAAGDAYGCHSCGTKNPLGPDAGETEKDIQDAKDSGAHFVPDHIPPAAIHTPRGKDKRHEIDVPKGGVRLFPQCRQCSNQQKNDVSSEKHRIRREGGDDEADKVAGVNAGAQAAFEKNKQVKPPTPKEPPKPKKGGKAR
jgi:RHS repeat-associated protein